METATQQATVRVLGLGSPHGDDQVAWQVIERLRHPPLPGVECAVVREPLGILNSLDHCHTLILVDACQSGAAPGTLWRTVWPDARLELRDRSSTHGLGLVHVLALAEKLGRLPARIVILGLEISSCAPGAPVSMDLGRAVPELCRRVRAEVLSILRENDNE
jgi:hydrogenase maturation protease